MTCVTHIQTIVSPILNRTERKQNRQLTKLFFFYSLCRKIVWEWDYFNAGKRSWQSIVQIFLYMHDLFVIPFKTTNSSTNERLIAIVIEYLYTPTVLCMSLSTATLQNFTTKINICQNLQLTEISSWLQLLWLQIYAGGDLKTRWLRWEGRWSH